MPQKAAYLEIGLRWRQGSRFDVTIDFDDPEDQGDRRQFTSQPIEIDPELLVPYLANAKEYGRRLTDMVLSEQQLLRFYNTTRGALASRTPAPPLHMRLFLDPSAPARFHSLRWETLHDGSRSVPVALQPGVFVSRFLNGDDWRPVAPPAKHDLRAVVVVSNPTDLDTYGATPLAPVDVQAELDRAAKGLSGMQTDIVGRDQPATLPAIRAAVETGVDVLYIVCHGGLGRSGPVLLLQQPDGRTAGVLGKDLVELVTKLVHRPTVAVLCSCVSAGADTTADDGALAAIGPGLAQAGIAAVVAMQGNISVETAETFMPELFQALREHGIVDRAMAAARLSVESRPDWWMPVLFSRLKRGRTYYLPEFGEETTERWRTILQRIDGGTCTPVLGPGLADDILASRSDIARDWADLWQMPIPADLRGDLVTVSQYLRVRVSSAQPADDLGNYLLRAFRDRYREELSPEQLAVRTPMELARVIGEYRREKDADDPYRIVASLELPVYVTTSWTTLLEDALTAAGRPPVVRSFEWYRDHDEELEDELAEPTPEQPLVYHLFGTLSEPDSLVLSEDDYFSWFAAWTRYRKDGLPSVVATALTRRSLLFLGYRLADWDFRVLFHSIKNFGASSQLRSRPHAGVQLIPHASMIEPESAKEYLEKAFGDDKVNIYWGTPRGFLAELERRWKEDRERAGVR